MKICLLLLLVLSFGSVQSQRNVAVGIGTNVSFQTKGVGLNDLGIGLQLQTNLFIKQPLQIRIEAGLDHFVGDNLLITDNYNNPYERNPTITRIVAGPEIFIHKKISVAAVYGAAWNNWENNAATKSALRFLFAGHLGKRNRFVPSVSYTTLPAMHTHYFTFSLGVQIF